MKMSAVHAEVVGATPSMESPAYAIAALRFPNAGATPTRVRRDRVVWSGGSIMTLPPTSWSPAVAHENGRCE